MCWVTNNFPCLKIAEEDIHVKKILYEDENGELYSPIFRSIKWEINEPKKSDIGPIRSLGKYSYKIDEGIHSCKNIVTDGTSWKDGYNIILFLCETGEKIVDAIIPTGARYYVNGHDNYVSDELIIL